MSIHYGKRAPSKNLYIPTRPIRECLNCHRTLVIKGRGLCGGCFKHPEIRLRFPSRAKAAVILYAEPVDAPLPQSPTTAIPGSVEKMDVMRKRATAKTQLFHPADARYPGDPRTLEYLAQTSQDA